jgi:hypothetical protein
MKPFGKWESFRIRRVALVSYITSYKGEQTLEVRKQALVMFGRGNNVWTWYPVKKDVLLDCKLMTFGEVSTIESATAERVEEILKPLWHDGKIKPLTPGMHPELVRKWKHTVRPFVRKHTPKPAPTGQ